MPTAVLLVKLVPHALALPSPGALRKVHDELELRVQERTAELLQTTRKLEAEIAVRRQTKKALRESRQHYQMLAESLPHLVWTCAPDGQCDYLSRQWVEYTGRPAEEQLGYGWAEQLHPEDRERVQTEWTKSAVRGAIPELLGL